MDAIESNDKTVIENNLKLILKTTLYKLLSEF
jgi:hypothetical protein